MLVSEGPREPYGVPLVALVALVPAEWLAGIELLIVLEIELTVLVTVVLGVLTE